MSRGVLSSINSLFRYLMYFNDGFFCCLPTCHPLHMALKQKTLLELTIITSQYILLQHGRWLMWSFSVAPQLASRRTGLNVRFLRCPSHHLLRKVGYTNQSLVNGIFGLGHYPSLPTKSRLDLLILWNPIRPCLLFGKEMNVLTKQQTWTNRVS